MARRTRRTGRYSPHPQALYDSMDEFVGTETTKGIHTIRTGGMTLDLLYVPQESESLLVFFPAAIKPDTTWPFFSGAGIARKLGMSLLAVSDPSTAFDRVPTGWCLGDQRFPLHQHLPRIIEAVAQGRRVVTVGLSAGGFAALHYSALIPGSVAVVGNPRTHLLSPPTAVQYWARAMYGTADPARIAELVPLAPASSTNRVVYLQNTDDHQYFAGHMIPYLHRLGPDADVWTLMGDWGKGHVPPPRELLDGVIRSAAVDPSEIPEGAVRFESVDAVLEQQASLNIAKHAR